MNAVLTLRLARQLSAAHSRAALKLLMPAAYDAFVVAGSELCRTCVCVVVCVVLVFFVCECECELANKPAACQDFGAGSKMLLRS